MPSFGKESNRERYSKPVMKRHIVWKFGKNDAKHLANFVISSIASIIGGMYDESRNVGIRNDGTDAMLLVNRVARPAVAPLEAEWEPGSIESSSNIIRWGRPQVLMEKLSEAQAELVVKAARKAIENYFAKRIVPKAELPKELDFDCGVFVTLKRYSTRGEKLRGCIGYPEPIYALSKALPKASVSAAVADPRFPPVEEGELENLTIEVSLLSRPEKVEVANRSDLPHIIKIGKHGIIIEKGIYKGLLLPQVAVEEGWESEEFLSYACMKAGLPPDEWLDDATQVSLFSARVFKELEPKGQVVEETLESKGR